MVRLRKIIIMMEFLFQELQLVLDTKPADTDHSFASQFESVTKNC